MVVRYRAGRSDWRSGGTVSWPAVAKDRLFLSYTTNGRCGDPPTVVVGWFGPRNRSVFGWDEETVPRPVGIYVYLLGALGDSNTSLLLVFRFVLFSSPLTHRFCSRFFIHQ